MKKAVSLSLAVILLCTFLVFALGSTESEKIDVTDNIIGDYAVDVKSFRLARDYDETDAIIITYSFTNNSDDSKTFNSSVEDIVYQGGMSLTEAYILPNSANYDYENKTKKIKSGATVDIEIAYKLNDTTTDIEVEIKDGSIFGDDDDVITKTFSIK